MRPAAFAAPLAAALALLTAGPAHACLEIVTAQSKARAFRAADLVVRVVTLTATTQPVPDTVSLRTGTATAKVVESLKGRAPRGRVITYQVADGEPDGIACPARRLTLPGARYTLYLKRLEKGALPVILLPVD